LVSEQYGFRKGISTENAAYRLIDSVFKCLNWILSKASEFVFVFLLAVMHNALVFNAIEGSIGLVNCPTSGWMADPLFLKVLQHIKQNIRCSK